MTLEDDMRVVTRYGTEDEATSALKLLTRQGIGALVEFGSESDEKHRNTQNQRHEIDAERDAGSNVDADADTDVGVDGIESGEGGGAVPEIDEPGAVITGYAVLVVLGDLMRACEVLGVEPSGSLEEELAALGRRRFPDWVYVLAIFLVAVITLPLIAYFISYKVSGG